MAKGESESISVIGPLLTTRPEHIAEYRRRKAQALQKRIDEAELAKVQEEGWSVGRTLKSGKIIVEKRKSHDEILENRLWSVVYNFGASEICQGRNCRIEVSAEDGKISRQIDVFAKFDDIVVVAECKSATSKKKRQLQHDIGEFASMQRPIANSLRRHYGTETKLKIIWILATHNIIWSEQDRTRAKDQNIQVIEERELRYFEEISRSIGPAAQYQFLGEFLAGQNIPSLANYFVPAIRTKLGGQWAFYFIAPADRLLPIAFVNHRGLRDPEGAPAYQRVLKRSRLREIGTYLDAGGFFPNCITVNFRRSVRFDRQKSSDGRQLSFGQLYLPDEFKSVWVIDGQHRLYGFTETSAKRADHVIPVLAFEKLPTTDEANLFATINSKQQRVARGLLDELAGELKLGSEIFSERSGAVIARTFDLMCTTTGNPFEERIKSADLPESETACLTISELKKGAMAAKLLGTEGKDGVILPGPFTRGTAEAEVDALFDGLTAYFSKVQSANLLRWDAGRSGNVCSNVGIQGYMRLLQAILEHYRTTTGVEPSQLDPEELIEQINDYLDPVLEFVAGAQDEEFNKLFKPTFGSGGPPRYFTALCRFVRQKIDTFNPAGLEQLLTQEDADVADRGDELTKSVQDRVHKHTVQVLKSVYGGEKFFERGVPSKDIKKEVLNKRVDDNDRMPPENYFDFIQLKKIIEHNQNWEHFKTVFNIKLPDERNGQAKYVKWFDRINEIRRISAHPHGRKYAPEDIDVLEAINEHLSSAGI